MANQCFLIGNLTKNPEFSTSQSGIPFCKFTIAVNRPYSTASGEREVDFINVCAFRQLAENCDRYLSKGKKVCVIGALQIRSYEDRDGNKRTAAEIAANSVEFLSPRGEAEQEARPRNRTLDEIKDGGQAEEDLPF